jgi:tRNA dimethylallyltransferase
MQVYRGMDIGTAKPSPAVRRRVPHHCIDELELNERYSANDFAQRAGALLQDLQNAGVPAVLVGGTGLYAKALVYGLRLQPADPDVYAAADAEFTAPGGPERLRAELAAAWTSCPTTVLENPRRLLRAIEILRVTGRPPIRPNTTAISRNAGQWQQFVILATPQALTGRITERCRHMFAAGWVAETRSLIAAGLLQSPTARQALGYRDIAEFLQQEGGNAEEEKLIQRVTSRTLQYARRQRTWFRHQHPGACLLTIRSEVTTPAIATAILSTLRHANLSTTC